MTDEDVQVIEAACEPAVMELRGNDLKKLTSALQRMTEAAGQPRDYHAGFRDGATNLHNQVVEVAKLDPEATEEDLLAWIRRLVAIRDAAKEHVGNVETKLKHARASRAEVQLSKLLRVPASEPVLDHSKSITVCASCLRASCLNGVLYCENYRGAGATKMPVCKLALLARENPSYWEGDEG